MESIRKYFPIAAGIFSLCFILLVNTVPAFSQTTSITIFGPKQYDKPKGKPVTYTDTFQTASTTGTYTLWVQSGAAGLNEVKNVSVSINGVEIIGSSDLRNNNPASKVISIQSTNTLTVTLKGQGGNYITVKVLCEGCSPSVTGIIPPEGGTITLEGYASVTFPAGAFAASQNVTVSQTSEPKTQSDFEFVPIEFIGPHLPYEIRINTGYSVPSTSFEVVLKVPDYFIASLPQGYEIDIYAQVYESPESPEIYDHFHDFPSIFDPITKTVKATIPKYAFTDRRTKDDTYEAIIIVGTFH